MKVINLDEYFYSTKKKYYFVDGLLTKESDSKYNILKRNGISENSYRTDRLKENVKNDNIDILLEYFNYNNIYANDKVRYEVVLSKIYYCVYYNNQEELKKLYNELDELIDENNILKPMFILFKIFIIVNLDYKITELKDKVKDYLEYIFLFKKKYFSNEIYLLYKIILYYFDLNKDLKELELLSTESLDFNWVYYQLRANKHYLNYENHEALLYYYSVVDIYSKTKNMNRLFRTTATIAAILNSMNKYSLAIKECSILIEYAYSSKNEDWIKAITQHYLYSHYMMSNYKFIINFLEIIIFDVKLLSETSSIICILAAYEYGDMSRVKNVIEYAQNMPNVKIILQFISTGNENLFNDLKKTDYLINIANKLTKN